MTCKNKAVNIVLLSSICALLQACGGSGTNDGSISDIDLNGGTTALTDEPTLGEALGEETAGTVDSAANIPIGPVSSFSSASTNGCLLYTSPSPRD